METNSFIGKPITDFLSHDKKLTSTPEKYDIHLYDKSCDAYLKKDEGMRNLAVKAKKIIDYCADRGLRDVRVVVEFTGEIKITKNLLPLSDFEKKNYPLFLQIDDIARIAEIVGFQKVSFFPYNRRKVYNFKDGLVIQTNPGLKIEHVSHNWAEVWDKEGLGVAAPSAPRISLSEMAAARI